MIIGNYRGSGLAVVLTLLTCGLYRLYHTYVVSEEMNRYTGRPEQSGAVDVLLTIITFGIWHIFWDYKAGKRMAEMTRMAGLPITDNAVLYVILSIFGLSILNIYMQQDTLNRVWSARPPYGGVGVYPEARIVYPQPPYYGR